ncbi:hypothetical protein SAMN05421807_102243 [Virgibacillus chiguensis]|uniref:Uncharacterized protein n=1 Tax=Virgibacillus chiguensis TaxID=411959 RepID=A0A1M5NJ13_9BACI|nr:hypothetical protein SAMN05421807_102243 [Virgibacillus chiguensis]
MVEALNVLQPFTSTQTITKKIISFLIVVHLLVI